MQEKIEKMAMLLQNASQITGKSHGRPSPDSYHKLLNSKQSSDELNSDGIASLVPTPMTLKSVKKQPDLAYLWSDPLVQEVEKEGKTKLMAIEMPL